MNTFFDLREFLITLLKKMKISLIIIILFAFVGGLMRFVPLMQEYLSFDERVAATKTIEVESDYPYFYEARRTLYIEPNYIVTGDSVVDTSDDVTQAYQKCYQNKEVLQPLVAKYFEEATRLYYQNIEGQIKYNYINKIAVTDFKLEDFYRWFTINVSNNFVDLRAKTPNVDFSETIVSEFEHLLSQYVKNLVGDYSYIVTEGQIGTTKPTALNGLIPIDDSQVPSETITKPNISYILVRSIKGIIWGIGAGIGFSIILGFFVQCLSLTIVSEGDMKVYPVKILASLRIKKNQCKLSSIVNHLIDILEGNANNCVTYEETAKLASAFLNEKNKLFKTVIVTGSASFPPMKMFADALQNEMKDYKVLCGECITTHSNTVEKVIEADIVLLYEKIGESNKEEIYKEIDRIQFLKREIIGMVLEK